MWNIGQFIHDSCISTLILLVIISCVSSVSSFSEAGNGADGETASCSVVKIGNPNLKQLPSTSFANNFARSVWDMYCYKDRVYLGAGDYMGGSARVDVWSFDADGNFKKEYTTDDEQIHIFREYESKLFVPGIDAKESWLYGNLYVKDDDEWQKLRTIPDGVHVFDVALLDGDIYVTMSSSGYAGVLKSSDMGQTWAPIIEDHRDNSGAFFREMVASGDSLLIMGTSPGREPCVYRYTDGNTETLINDMERSSPHNKITAFGDGVVYMVNSGPLISLSASPLMFLNDFTNGSVIIKEFQQKRVRDVFVRDDICYVLATSESKSAFLGYVYSSPDLDDWTKLAEFSVPELPQSFEVLDGVFYVGLGGINAESGSIYRLDMEYSPVEPPAWDIDRDGVVGISDFVILGQHLGETLTTPLEPDPDVNADGKVDILDVVLVGQHFGETYLPAAPSRYVWKVDPE